jgi:hypothetical protein
LDRIFGGSYLPQGFLFFLPDQKKEAQRRKRVWGHSDVYAYTTIAFFRYVKKHRVATGSGWVAGNGASHQLTKRHHHAPIQLQHPPPTFILLSSPLLLRSPPPALFSFALVYGVLVSVLAMFPSTMCLQIAGGEGCPPDGDDDGGGWWI